HGLYVQRALHRRAAGGQSSPALLPRVVPRDRPDSKAGTRGSRLAPLVSRAVVLAAALALAGGVLAFDIPWSVDVAAWIVLATAFTVVGMLVISRVPANPFGWLVLAIGATSAIAVGTWSDDLTGVLAWLLSWIL